MGLLVLGVFNAAIGRQNIRSDLVYDPLVRADVLFLHGTDACGTSTHVLMCHAPFLDKMEALTAAAAVDQRGIL